MSDHNDLDGGDDGQQEPEDRPAADDGDGSMCDGDNATGSAENRAFLERADRFLAVANAMASDVPFGQVSAAMMFATARFNAFFAQSEGLEPGEVDEETVAYFRAEYEKMLRENLAQVLSSRRVTGI